MADPRFLLVRLGSLGDIIHALPAAAASPRHVSRRANRLGGRAKWARLLEGNPDISEVISPWIAKAPAELLWNGPKSCAPRNIHARSIFRRSINRRCSHSRRARRAESAFKAATRAKGLAALFYTDRLNPRGPHKVDHNLTLAECAGAREIEAALSARDSPGRRRDRSRASWPAQRLREYFVLNPGGGWRSKCWPAERYGELHRKLVERYRLARRGQLRPGRGRSGAAR